MPTAPLASRLPTVGSAAASDPDELLSRFLDHVAAQGLSLYPAQEDALLELFAGRNVILNTPTGSGKSLVATALHFKSMAEGRKSYYTCPIKALVSEKFFALCQDFGPENVGMLTGDASINRDAPIVCCTAEILANMALRQGEDAPVDHVVMDEFHYYSDRDRGMAWQVPLLVLSRATFLLMSATLGDTRFFEESLTTLTGRPTVLVKSGQRPVPLDFEYRETPLHETVMELVNARKYPVYIVNFTQRACAEEAQNLMSQDWCTRDEKKKIADAVRGYPFDSPYGKEVQKFVKHGVGLHHAGLLPRYRLLVEKLAQQGMLKIICGTDTLGVGVNIPIRTVLFTKLCKYDGEKTAILSVRDFQQIAGRAGRKGFDDQGSVVVQAPEHVIENLRAESKAQGDPGKMRKLVKRKPPEKGYVHWDRSTFERLVNAQPEPLVSRFQVTHGVILNVLERERGGGCMGLGRLIKRSHGRDAEKRSQGRTAVVLVKSLLDAGVVEFVLAAGGGRKVKVNADLQEDFSLNHALSLYVLDTLPKIDPESGTYPLDVLTLVESIAEDPTIVLQKQLDRLKTEKLFELKAQGVEYEQRMEELEKLEYPKPNRDFIYDTFNAFAAKHPWVAGDNIRPKSVAREMYETYASFSDYVKDYELQRSEGVLLRYLSDVYKALVQNVPISARNDDVYEVIAYLRTMLRDVDSSLLDEWERLHAPDVAALPVEVAPTLPAMDETRDVTRDSKAFTAAIRREVARLVRALASRDAEAAAKLVDVDASGEDAWTAERFDDTLKDFYKDHSALRTDQEARSPKYIAVTPKSDDAWSVKQTLLDADDHNDWVLDAVVDILRSREAGRPVIIVRWLGP